MPAVSRILSGTPAMFRYSSSTSRVVPGTSVTIARSCLSSAFKSDDLPTFGLPTMAVAKPSRRILPQEALESRPSIRQARGQSHPPERCPPSALDVLFGKIDACFDRGDDRDEPVPKRGDLPDSPPSSCSFAARRARSVLARMMSITASAWARSILSVQERALRELARLSLPSHRRRSGAPRCARAASCRRDS